MAQYTKLIRFSIHAKTHRSDFPGYVTGSPIRGARSGPRQDKEKTPTSSSGGSPGKMLPSLLFQGVAVLS